MKARYPLCYYRFPLFLSDCSTWLHLVPARTSFLANNRYFINERKEGTLDQVEQSVPSIMLACIFVTLFTYVT